MTIEFMENAWELDELYKVAQAAESEDYKSPGLNALRLQLTRGTHAFIDTICATSYDCHSSSSSVLKYLGIPTLVPPEADYPEYPIDSLMWRLGQGDTVLNSTEFKQYTEQHKRFTERLYEEGHKLPIPSPCSEDQAREIVAHALETMQQSPSSRLLYISNGTPKDDYLDLHSTIALGPTEDGDLWTFGKNGQWTMPHLRRFSETVFLIALDTKNWMESDEGPNYRVEMNLNVLKKPVTDLFE